MSIEIAPDSPPVESLVSDELQVTSSSARPSKVQPADPSQPLGWPETAVKPVLVRWRYAISIPLIHLLACLAFVPWLFS